MHYKSNFYSVPQGTYQGPDTYATIKENAGNVEIYLDEKLLASHKLSHEEGKTIINTHHKRGLTRKPELLIC